MAAGRRRVSGAFRHPATGRRGLSSAGGEGQVFPVAFDELAIAEDLARLGSGAAEALDALAREIGSLGGLPRGRLLACAAEGRDGTSLGGCVKTYVPWPAGRFGAVMVPVHHRERPLGLRVVAFGVRHQPRGAHALTVYQIAHGRLNG